MSFAAPPPASTTQFAVDGMSCQNCARHVREAAQSIPAVADAHVELEANRLTVRWRTTSAVSPPPSPSVPPSPLDAVLHAVREAGFEIRALPSADPGPLADPASWSPFKGWRFNVVVGSLATLPLMLGEWMLGLGMNRAFHWTAFALTVPVMLFCGAKFFRGAWHQIRRGQSNMDTLVSLGSTTAFTYSTWGLFAGWHAHLYFMEAAAIITVISIGHWLETIISARAVASLHALLNLAPQTARRLAPDGSETSVPVSTLQLNDRVLLKPGDAIPTDGEVLTGQSAVNEAMLTGESLPVEKSAGAKLYAGTVNQNGRLEMRVTALGEATALARIITIVQHAQNSRAGIQKLGDQVSSVFVPIVVLIALGTALWWGLAPDSARAVHAWLAPFLWHSVLPDTALAAAFIQAAAVLIVACPCAMGLATPVAIMAGTNAAARRGILIRDGTALEKSGRITAVLFDKTGTLTQGRITVAATEDLRKNSAAEPSLPALAAALTQPSNHPLSQAVAAWAKSVPTSGSTPVLDQWQESRGLGVHARWQSGTLRLGSLTWLRESGVTATTATAATTFCDHWTAQGSTVLGLAHDAQLLGLFALRDTIKPHAADVIAKLIRQGQKVFLVTGDNPRTAAAIAQAAGISAENVFAEIRPEHKADIVGRLQQRGEQVAFVGDGINDAPALEQADLGIAVSQAGDVARESADIILLNADIQAVPEALGLAQATLRTIKQNLFWAFFYNAAAIPLAALGYLSPVLCAAAMGLSDLIVIGNALRLRRWRT
ncbi:copper-translocating P-type ATPase [Verrucomicrobiota bacterium]|nr:copper-translocating P-type ATPase [Verrucomicrobiota bacterium]